MSVVDMDIIQYTSQLTARYVHNVIMILKEIGLFVLVEILLLLNLNIYFFQIIHI
jgi:hypothetical protein